MSYFSSLYHLSRKTGQYNIYLFVFIDVIQIQLQLYLHLFTFVEVIHFVVYLFYTIWIFFLDLVSSDYKRYIFVHLCLCLTDSLGLINYFHDVSWFCLSFRSFAYLNVCGRMSRFTSFPFLIFK